MNEVGKKYNRSTLYKMRQFYIVFSSEKVAPLARQLSWSHYIEVLSLKDENGIIYSPFLNCILLISGSLIFVLFNNHIRC